MGKEVRTVNNSHADIRMYIARSHRAEHIRAAARERQFHSAIGRQSQSIRRSIGHSIIRIGQRMAAESSMSSARSAQG
jgi:hypothetical protein